MSRRILARALLTITIFAPACTGATADGEDGETSEGNFDDGTGLPEGDCVGACGTPNCGVCPTATDMVDGAGFQIDSVEVNNGQYAAMLEVEFGAEALPAGCEWKSGFTPQDWADGPADDLPVVGVDWCDAAMFCAWVGKRLCGAIGGGPGDADVADDPDSDEWYSACSGAGASDYPYGASYDAAACNGDESGLGMLVPSGSLATCEGGLPELFDMSGNVWEWTNACEAEGGDASTQCRRRGGGRHSDLDALRCSLDSLRARGTRDNSFGIRCCAL